MKRTIIKNFKELVDVFPNLSLHQIIMLYASVQKDIDRLQYLIRRGSHRYSKEELETMLSDRLMADAFLGTYLARAYCRQNGYTRG